MKDLFVVVNFFVFNQVLNLKSVKSKQNVTDLIGEYFYLRRNRPRSVINESGTYHRRRRGGVGRGEYIQC